MRTLPLFGYGLAGVFVAASAAQASDERDKPEVGVPRGLNHFFPNQYTGRRERIAASKNSEKDRAMGPQYSGFGHASW